jgi:hypothetical protein
MTYMNIQLWERIDDPVLGRPFLSQQTWLGLRRSTLENIVGLQVLNLQDTAVIVLNATHTTGSCRLPSDLLDIYIRYKQGTRASLFS